jgi:zinc/manganese transport system substrate-binding protein
VVALSLAGIVLALGACRASSPRAGGRVVTVVAAENFWASIAAQLGGTHARVTSIITRPQVDPHSYEPTAADARVLAGAQLVIENGLGYDPWATKLLNADDSAAVRIDVGRALGLPADSNPHRWYNPGDTRKVIAAVVAALKRLDPPDAAYFDSRAKYFETEAMAPYYSAIDAVRARYAGTKVGASESIFSMLAPALGLDVVTPASFLRAISEGTDVSAADKATVDAQIRARTIKVFVYNSQNLTPDVQAELSLVRTEHIPVVAVTETLSPAGATYQDWQTRQLRAIAAALAGSARAPAPSS